MRRQQYGVVIATLVVAVITPVVVTVAASPANATAYRYWSYWHQTGAGWEFSKIGATGAHPADGTVEGWRFAVSPGTATAPAPRYPAATAFSSICGSTPTATGKKRVALVVDFGVAEHAPSGDSPPADALRGSCVSIRTAATGMDVLVAGDYAIRTDSGLVCGLAGYPTKGCGVVVADPAPAPTKPAATSPAGGSKRTTTPTGTANNGGGGTSDDPVGDSPSTRATSSTGASSSARPSASPTRSGTADAIPSADPLDTSSALPTLVNGAPAASTSGSSSNPLRAGLALLLVAGIAAAAFARTRLRRSSP